MEDKLNELLDIYKDLFKQLDPRDELSRGKRIILKQVIKDIENLLSY